MKNIIILVFSIVILNGCGSMNLFALVGAIYVANAFIPETGIRMTDNLGFKQHFVQETKNILVSKDEFFNQFKSEYIKFGNVIGPTSNLFQSKCVVQITRKTRDRDDYGKYESKKHTSTVTLTSSNINIDEYIIFKSEGDILITKCENFLKRISYSGCGDDYLKSSDKCSVKFILAA